MALLYSERGAGRLAAVVITQGNRRGACCCVGADGNRPVGAWGGPIAIGPYGFLAAMCECGSLFAGGWINFNSWPRFLLADFRNFYT